MTDAEIDALREKMDEQSEEIRDYLEGEGVDVSPWDDEAHDTVPDADREPVDSD
ncbi:hypothetical protein [Saliphagus infecundisoli]|uniref:Uncharacterized protein n=1 Tax=Saliphagus infecundisoli TaxID=1849069 RepID=A0ABD5QLG8_9EURY|nr:hypothetical protein [Saliphagus infecundisoli]